MKISPINNQISHKAVNQKFFNKAVEKYNKYAPYHNQGHLITMIYLKATYKLLSYEDAIDTLKAIKPYAQKEIEEINEIIDIFKDCIKSNQ